MNENDVQGWLTGYVEAFGACARGETDPRSLLGYWGVPLLIATADDLFTLVTEDQVVSAAQQQIDRLRAASFDHTHLHGGDVTVLNPRAALLRADLSWRRADGDEISRPTVTYLVTDGSAGRRISALVPHVS